jgi:hypothetical protein
VGFSYGIFLPKQRPSPDYFVAVKEGDYDGRLFLISREGQVTDLPGGFYFVPAARRFLVKYVSDTYALTVFDLEKDSTVLAWRDVLEMGQLVSG